MANKFLDLVYHGYECDKDSAKDQKEFRELMNKHFPEVEIEDAYDPVKGYRTVFYAGEEFDRDVYYAFLIAFGFYNGSFSFLITKKENMPNKEKVLDIIRERWPECLKEEYR